MNQEELDNIWNKIRKIMALQESATKIGEEGEAQAAAAAITRLLLKYDLSMEDIPNGEKIKNRVVLRDITFKVPYDNLQWYSFMIGIVCTENSCQHLLGWKYDGKKMVRCHKVVGREKNVEIVLYLISFLSNHFLAAAKRSRRNPDKKLFVHNRQIFLQTDVPVQVYMKSFLLGCVFGLERKLEEEKKAFSTSEITALTIRTSKEIEDFFEQENMQIANARKTSIKSLDPVSFSKGKQVGRNTDFVKGLGEHKEEEYFINR